MEVTIGDGSFVTHGGDNEDDSIVTHDNGGGFIATYCRDMVSSPSSRYYSVSNPPGEDRR